MTPKTNHLLPGPTFDTEISLLAKLTTDRRQQKNIIVNVDKANGDVTCVTAPPLGARSQDLITKRQIRLETKVELGSFAAFMAQIQQTSVTGGVDPLPKHS